MNMQTKDIQQLLDRFMAGDTTRAEEQRLTAYFRTHRVKREWKAYQEMFAYFDRGMTNERPKQKRKSIALRRLLIGLSAAAILAGAVWFIRQPEPPSVSSSPVAINVQPSVVQPVSPATSYTRTPPKNARRQTFRPKRNKRNITTAEPYDEETEALARTAAWTSAMIEAGVDNRSQQADALIALFAAIHEEMADDVIYRMSSPEIVP